jgi:Protein of unknown function (DUF3309)
MLWTVLMIILFLSVLGALLNAERWGYWPGGLLGLIVVVLLVLFLMGRL